MTKTSDKADWAFNLWLPCQSLFALIPFIITLNDDESQLKSTSPTAAAATTAIMYHLILLLVLGNRTGQICAIYNFNFEI